jgi:hypothetical protein
MSKSVDLSDKVAAQLYLNSDFLAEGDFIGDDGKYREFTLTIARITRDELQLPGRSSKESKVVLAFEGATKRLVCNKTNVHAIKSHYGKQVADWISKKITVKYDPSVKFGRDTVGGVRVKGK